MHNLKKNTILSFFSLGSKLATNIFVVMALARFLSISDYGLFAYAFSVTTISSIIVDYGFNIQSIKYLSNNYYETNRYIVAVMILKIFFALSMVIVVAIFGAISNYDFKTWSIIFLMCLGSIFNSYAIFIGTIYRSINRFSVDAITSIISSSVFVFAIMVTGVLSGDVVAIAYIYAAVRLLYMIMNWSLLLRDKLCSFEMPRRNYLKVIARQSLPFGVHAFFGALYFNADTIIIKEYLSLTDVALYQAVSRILLAIVFIAEILSSAHYPVLARLSNVDFVGFARIKRNYNLISIIISVAMCVIIIYFSETIIKMLYGTQYSSAAIILKILALSIPIKFLGYSYGTLLSSVNLQMVRAKVAVIASALIIALNLLFLKKWGLHAAAFSNVAVNAFVLVAYVRCFYAYYAVDVKGMT